MPSQPVKICVICEQLLAVKDRLTDFTDNHRNAIFNTIVNKLPFALCSSKLRFDD